MKKQQKCYIYTRVSTAIQVDNPIYMGKMPYGRRSNEKIQGTRNEYHVVKQDEYDLYDGIHEAIISEDDFRLAAQKRKYRILKSFDKIYGEFTDAEKKRFINSFVERVEISEEEQEDGSFLKSIKFRFPVYYNGAETQEVDLSDSGWDYQRSLENIVLLTKTTA